MKSSSCLVPGVLGISLAKQLEMFAGSVAELQGFTFIHTSWGTAMPHTLRRAAWTFSRFKQFSVTHQVRLRAIARLHIFWRVVLASWLMLSSIHCDEELVKSYRWMLHKNLGFKVR